MTFSRILLSAAIVGSVALAATAGSDEPNPAVEARQGHMRLQGLNIGVLAQMARGNTEYDAATAQAAADNLMAISMLDQRFYWPPGTDNESIEGTRALPAIWQEGSQAMAIGADLVAATQGLSAAAGQGLDAMRAALGPVGSACTACHDDYRQPQ